MKAQNQPDRLLERAITRNKSVTLTDTQNNKLASATADPGDLEPTVHHHHIARAYEILAFLAYRGEDIESTEFSLHVEAAVKFIIERYEKPQPVGPTSRRTKRAQSVEPIAFPDTWTVIHRRFERDVEIFDTETRYLNDSPSFVQALDGIQIRRVKQVSTRCRLYSRRFHLVSDSVFGCKSGDCLWPCCPGKNTRNNGMHYSTSLGSFGVGSYKSCTLTRS